MSGMDMFKTIIVLGIIGIIISTSFLTEYILSAEDPEETWSRFKRLLGR